MVTKACRRSKIIIWNADRLCDLVRRLRLLMSSCCYNIHVCVFVLFKAIFASSPATSSITAMPRAATSGRGDPSTRAARPRRLIQLQMWSLVPLNPSINRVHTSSEYIPQKPPDQKNTIPPNPSSIKFMHISNDTP